MSIVERRKVASGYVCGMQQEPTGGGISFFKQTVLHTHSGSCLALVVGSTTEGAVKYVTSERDIFTGAAFGWLVQMKKRGSK